MLAILRTMGAVIVPFSEENPIKRLLEMDKKFQNLKNSTMPLVNAIMMKAVGALPSFLVYFILGRIYQSTSFITVSNLAGPTTPIDFGGYPVLDFLFSSGASVGTNGEYQLVYFFVVCYILIIFFLSSHSVTIISVWKHQGGCWS